MCVRHETTEAKKDAPPAAAAPLAGEKKKKKKEKKPEKVQWGPLSLLFNYSFSLNPLRLFEIILISRIFQSGNFDQTGKIREFYPKYWKSMENNSINKLKKSECLLAIYPKIILALLRSVCLS